MFFAIEEFNSLVERPHGDLSLNNIVIDSKHRVKLIDYEVGMYNNQFASIQQHLHDKDSKFTICDDLESFGYILLYL